MGLFHGLDCFEVGEVEQLAENGDCRADEVRTMLVKPERSTIYRVGNAADFANSFNGGIGRCGQAKRLFRLPNHKTALSAIHPFDVT
ncbi:MULTISPECIES: hypothetical protein [unclassified Rhizobium]|uniref:hypothetical protein n=1 Tax=unclassified Rhizobium TaxID=2613769 RepID=UPI000A4547B5|nr:MULTISPECIES: hypothetical protein [unclassified Rhizobium]